MASRSYIVTRSGVIRSYVINRGVGPPGSDAEVTTANVRSAGALMDDEVTNLADLKAFDPAAYATAAQGAKADTALQPIDLPKANYAATTAPTITDDSAAGYSVGSPWCDTVGNECYRCVDAAVGAAIWIESTFDGAEVAALIAVETAAREAADAAEIAARDAAILLETNARIAAVNAEEARALLAEAAVQAYADGLVIGLLDDRGNWDASVNTYPTSNGSGPAGAIRKGDVWQVSVAGTVNAVSLGVGDMVRALVDNAASTTDASWGVLEDSGLYATILDLAAEAAARIAEDALKAPLASPTFTGTVEAPAYTVGGAASTGTGGLARAISPTLTTPDIGAATGTSFIPDFGTKYGMFGPTIRADGGIIWNSINQWNGGTEDTHLTRGSAGVLRIGLNGANALGSLSLANLTASGNVTGTNLTGTNTGDNAANTNAGLVHTTGAETIAGAKTFTANNTFSGTQNFSFITCSGIGAPTGGIGSTYGGVYTINSYPFSISDSLGAITAQMAVGSPGSSGGSTLAFTRPSGGVLHLTADGNITASGNVTGANLVYTSGTQTIADAKTFTTAPKSTGALTGDANELPTVSQTRKLHAALIGTDWDYVEEDRFIFKGTPFGNNTLTQFHVFSGNANTTYETEGINVYAVSAGGGVGLMCLPTGAAKSTAVGLNVGSLSIFPAGQGPRLPTTTKDAVFAQYKLPTATNRTGRIYYLTGATAVWTGAHSADYTYPNLRFNGASNSLECETSNGVAQTTSGAVSGGTFTAYTISDATREILVRRTNVGGTITVEIAPYSSTPSWSTVYSGTASMTFDPLATQDGSASGAAISTANEFRVIHGSIAIKL